MQNEKRQSINKIKRLNERLNNINQEIEKDEASIKHFLELLERRTHEDITESSYYQTTVQHQYIQRLLNHENLEERENELNQE